MSEHLSAARQEIEAVLAKAEADREVDKAKEDNALRNYLLFGDAKAIAELHVNLDQIDFALRERADIAARRFRDAQWREFLAEHVSNQTSLMERMASALERLADR